eukprot:PITA_15622
MTGMLNIAEPSNFYEAIKSFEWKEATKKEYESIIKNKTWDLVKLADDKQPIGCRWLFKLKFKADGSIDKYKARLVAKGYSQKEGCIYALQQNNKLQVNDGSKYADATLYRQLVGSLIYLTTTRPDLAYAVSVLSQFMTQPHENPWLAAKGVLRYLQGTSDFGVLYSDSFDVSLTSYIDFDWVGNLDDRRSIIGYAFSIASGVISWCSKKQHIVALSSAEAEYQAMCATTCDAVWLCRLLQDAREEQTEDTFINCDNQSSIKLAYNPVFHKSTKHIDTQFHFVREKVQSK